MTKDFRLVYSSDTELNKKCSKCKELLSECLCRIEEPIKDFKGPVAQRIEKQGRSGKTVTVIDRFPLNDSYLKNLTALLKKKCGAGGTYSLTGKHGVIEIQGDKRDLIRATLEKEGISIKG